MYKHFYSKEVANEDLELDENINENRTGDKQWYKKEIHEIRNKYTSLSNEDVLMILLLRDWFFSSHKYWLISDFGVKSNKFRNLINNFKEKYEIFLSKEWVKFILKYSFEETLIFINTKNEDEEKIILSSILFAS